MGEKKEFWLKGKEQMFVIFILLTTNMLNKQKKFSLYWTAVIFYSTKIEIKTLKPWTPKVVSHIYIGPSFLTYIWLVGKFYTYILD